MARDRQRAKQRQAERREARAAARREGGDELDEKAGPLAGMSGAPPENTGRSDTVAESPPPPPLLDNEGRIDDDDEDLDDVDPELEADAMEAGALGEGEGQVYEDELAPADGGGDGGTSGPRGVRGGRGEPLGPGQPVAQTSGSKVLNFLKACWAELQRVQWPDRQTLTQLTGIVLFFCVLAGTYLGLLDALFSEIIQAIL